MDNHDSLRTTLELGLTTNVQWPPLERDLFRSLLAIFGTLNITSSDENASTLALSLLSLPAEIREQIYGHTFHEEHDQLCKPKITSLGILGCWCGDGLSTTNRQLYEETRTRFYKCVTFTFRDVARAEHFFRDCRHITEWVTSLKVTYANSTNNCVVLRDVFKHLWNSNLRFLRLDVISPPSVNPPLPLYARTSLESKEISAVKYDILLRPLRCPFNWLETIALLEVFGSPDPEVEEVVFRLSISMEARADREGKRINKIKTESGTQGWHLVWSIG